MWIRIGHIFTPRFLRTSEDSDKVTNSLRLVDCFAWLNVAHPFIEMSHADTLHRHRANGPVPCEPAFSVFDTHVLWRRDGVAVGGSVRNAIAPSSSALVVI